MKAAGIVLWCAYGYIVLISVVLDVWLPAEIHWGFFRAENDADGGDRSPQ